MFVTGGILEAIAAILSFGVKGGLFDHASWIYQCKVESRAENAIASSSFKFSNFIFIFFKKKIYIL